MRSLPGSLFKPEKPIKDPRHLDAVRQLPCILCGGQSEPAHVRYQELKYQKVQPGIGRKPGDNWVVPLCPGDHRSGKRAQHRYGERRWWEGLIGIDPLPICIALYAVSPDVIEMRKIIIRIRYDRSP